MPWNPENLPQFDGSTRAEDLPALTCAPFVRHEFGRSIGFSEEDEGRVAGKTGLGKLNLHMFFVDVLGLKGCF